jgi:hypothetical protein
LPQASCSPPPAGPASRLARTSGGVPQISPLKIGILGAARIADDGIVEPSKLLGHRLVTVAARDRSRAEAFPAQRGVEKVHQTYAEVIDDPEVEVVYNALVNSLHAKWNFYALNAGKHVLSEKPFASNATEALLVRDVTWSASGQIVEGCHYLHHPVNQRLRELDQTSYTYQLGALAQMLQSDADFLIDIDGSVANAELIDEVYRSAGLSPHG